MYYVRARSESIAKQPPQAMSMASFGGGGEAPSAKLKAGAAAAVVDTAPIIKTPPYVAAVGEINTIVDTIERKSTWGPRAWGSGGVGVAWPGLRWPTIARGFVFEQPGKLLSLGIASEARGFPCAASVPYLTYRMCVLCSVLQ